METAHRTVTVERTYDAPPARVFEAWRNPMALARWYVPGDGTWNSTIVEHVFRVGGRKHLTFGPHGGPAYSEDCRYEDIVENRRLCFSMTIATEGRRMTTSMVTVEFRPNAKRTDLKVTDQMVVLDGGDADTNAREREAGWHETIGKLTAELARG